MWSGLYTVLKKHPEDHLFRYAKVGAGLTRPDYADWFKDFTQKLDTDHITVAVIMFGANDQQSIRDDKQKGHLFQTEGWKTVYAGHVDAILDELAKRKIKAIWPDGNFASHLPDSAGHSRQVRAEDGIHFTPWGYQLVAEKVYGVLTQSH